jgi:hypothetical protein
LRWRHPSSWLPAVPWGVPTVRRVAAVRASVRARRSQIRLRRAHTVRLASAPRNTRCVSSKPRPASPRARVRCSTSVRPPATKIPSAATTSACARAASASVWNPTAKPSGCSTLGNNVAFARRATMFASPTPSAGSDSFTRARSLARLREPSTNCLPCSALELSRMKLRRPCQAAQLLSFMSM